MMYASLGLPVMVKEATKDLPQHLIKDCFSHILITGKRSMRKIKLNIREIKLNMREIKLNMREIK